MSILTELRNENSGVDEDEDDENEEDDALDEEEEWSMFSVR